LHVVEPKGCGTTVAGTRPCREAIVKRTVSRIVEYVDANYAARISLRDVADALGYSPAYLTCMFRKRVGIPVTAWIIRRRISEAQRLLCESAATVNEICEHVGFSDVCYFTRQFVRHVGATPGRYRFISRRQRRAAQHHADCVAATPERPALEARLRTRGDRR
jgi:AraC-like DNA-binding protein